MTGFLKENGFTGNPINLCVMNKTINGKQVTMVIYVDDLLFFVEERTRLEWCYELLNFFSFLLFRFFEGP